MDNNKSKQIILIVDDSPSNITILGNALGEDYQVRIATSGAMALKMVSEPAQLPELILLDIMMPEMDGYEVCRRLKAEESTRSIPVT